MRARSWLVFIYSPPQPFAISQLANNPSATAVQSRLCCPAPFSLETVL